MLHDKASYNQQGQQNAGYAVPQVTAAPRELRVLERVEGIRGGLAELVSRIESFHDRLSGSGSDAAAKTPISSGLLGMISDAEESLRRAHTLIESLHGSF